MAHVESVTSKGERDEIEYIYKYKYKTHQAHKQSNQARNLCCAQQCITAVSVWDKNSEREGTSAGEREGTPF